MRTLLMGRLKQLIQKLLRGMIPPIPLVSRKPTLMLMMAPKAILQILSSKLILTQKNYLA